MVLGTLPILPDRARDRRPGRRGSHSRAIWFGRGGTCEPARRDALLARMRRPDVARHPRRAVRRTHPRRGRTIGTAWHHVTGAPILSTEHANRTHVRGIGVSPGRAAGPVAQLAGAIPPPDAGQRLAADADVEAAAQEIAAHAAKVADGLNAAAESAEGEAAEILATTAQMAADPTLVTAAQAKVRDERKTPALAVWEA